MILTRTFTRPNVLGVFWYRKNVYGHSTKYPILRKINKYYHNTYSYKDFLENMENGWWTRRINQKPLAEFKKSLVGI